MKQFVLTLFCALCLNGCGDSQTQSFQNATLNQEFPLKMGQSAEVAGEGLVVSFVEVPEDSRCPTGAVCVATGNAKVKIVVAKSGQPTATLVLNTNPADGAAEGTFSAYTIKLLTLSPPGSDYVATLVVSAVVAKGAQLE